MKLTDFKILTFDLLRHPDRLGERHGRRTGAADGARRTAAEPATRSWRRMPATESAQQRWTPARRYSDLLAIVYKRLAEEWAWR